MLYRWAGPSVLPQFGLHPWNWCTKAAYWLLLGLLITSVLGLKKNSFWSPCPTSFLPRLLRGRVLKAASGLKKTLLGLLLVWSVSRLKIDKLPVRYSVFKSALYWRCLCPFNALGPLSYPAAGLSVLGKVLNLYMESSSRSEMRHATLCFTC